jgi:hypothetical protein
MIRSPKDDSLAENTERVELHPLEFRAFLDRAPSGF